MRNQTEINKIICIGMHKTGTTTLGLALLDLGYSVVGARLDLAEPLLKGDIDKSIKLAGKFDALQDVPWALLYKELDKAYPNSKFILTQRDENSWLESVVRHFKGDYWAMHEWIYGSGVALGNEEIYLDKYRLHNKEVVEYFKDRPDDLLIFSPTEGDGWDKLCTFLNKDIPNKIFPYANKGKHKYTLPEKVYFSLRDKIPGSIRRKIMSFLGFPDRRNRFNNHCENREIIKNYKR